MSHTPGPWTANKVFSNRWNIEVLKPGFVPTCLAHVCTTILEVGVSEGDTDSNARLIAAAPELLAALKDFVHSVENKDQSWVDGSVVLARAAIAKAEGQS